jgi:shikimate kinase
VTRHVVLVGSMGSGKTTVGTELAERMGRQWVDNDALLAESTGLTAAEWVSLHGPAALHEAERVVAGACLADPRPGVIALAASVVDDPAAAELLAAHAVVWLRAHPETLVARIGDDLRRPFGAQMAETLRAQAAERSRRFAAVAHVVVDVDDRPPASVVEEIEKRLGPLLGDGPPPRP